MASWKTSGEHRRRRHPGDAAQARGSPMLCPTTIIKTMNTANSTRMQHIATATIVWIKFAPRSLREPAFAPRPTSQGWNIDSVALGAGKWPKLQVQSRAATQQRAFSRWQSMNTRPQSLISCAILCENSADAGGKKVPRRMPSAYEHVIAESSRFYNPWNALTPADADDSSIWRMRRSKHAFFINCSACRRYRISKIKKNSANIFFLTECSLVLAALCFVN